MFVVVEFCLISFFHSSCDKIYVLDVKRLQDIIVQHAPEPQKAPTHLEASLVKWNEMRRILNENTITGMATRKLSLGLYFM